MKDRKDKEERIVCKVRTQQAENFDEDEAACMVGSNVGYRLTIGSSFILCCKCCLVVGPSQGNRHTAQHTTHSTIEYKIKDK